MKRSKQIVKFISTFCEVKDFFLNGGCYWFAVILQEYCGGVIYYVPVVNHYIVKASDKFYDASGEVDYSEYNPQEWDEYKKLDPAETRRLIKYCIERR